MTDVLLAQKENLQPILDLLSSWGAVAGNIQIQKLGKSQLDHETSMVTLPPGWIRGFRISSLFTPYLDERRRCRLKVIHSRGKFSHREIYEVSFEGRFDFLHCPEKPTPGAISFRDRKTNDDFELEKFEPAQRANWHLLKQQDYLQILSQALLKRFNISAATPAETNLQMARLWDSSTIALSNVDLAEMRADILQAIEHYTPLPPT